MGLESLFSTSFLWFSSSTEDLGDEQTLVFVLLDCPAFGESIPESMGESTLRTLYLVTVEIVAAEMFSVVEEVFVSSARLLLRVIVTVAADVLPNGQPLFAVVMVGAEVVNAFIRTLPLTLRS